MRGDNEMSKRKIGIVIGSLMTAVIVVVIMVWADNHSKSESNDNKVIKISEEVDKASEETQLNIEDWIDKKEKETEASIESGDNIESGEIQAKNELKDSDADGSLHETQSAEEGQDVEQSQQNKIIREQNEEQEQNQEQAENKEQGQNNDNAGEQQVSVQLTQNSVNEQQNMQQIETPTNKEPAQQPTNQITQEGEVHQPINQYVDEVIRLVNEERSKKGLALLKKNETLCQAATVRSNEITSVFSHTRPNGSSCFTVVDEYNISYVALGENIAMGQKTPQEVMNSWMNSQGHRENILSGNFSEIGVGVVYYKQSYYWTQIFSRSSW